MIRRTEMEVMMKIMEKDLKIRQTSLVTMKKENEALKAANAHLQPAQVASLLNIRYLNTSFYCYLSQEPVLDEEK